MKYAVAAIMALLLSFNVLADLTAQENRLKDMLLSGDMTQLKTASKQIYNAKVANPEVLDIAAEILLKKYPYATRSDIDPLAWLARAIGASENGRYYSVLAEVIANTSNAKLERHAETALEDLPGSTGEQFVAGMYALPEGLYSKEADADVVRHLKEKMLAGDLSNLKQAAKEMTAKEIRSQVLGDLAAEILFTHYASTRDNQLDTFAWLTNAIGASGMGRYRDLLREVERNGNHRKLRRYAEKNLEALSGEATEQYQKGMFSGPLPEYAF